MLSDSIRKSNSFKRETKNNGVLLSLLLILGVLLGLTNCGYTPGVALPKDYRTIYLYEIFNDTDQAQMPDKIKTILKDEFTVDGRLIVVNDIDKADVLLALRILKYTSTPVTYGPNQLPDQIATAVIIKMALQDVKTNRILRTSEIEEKILYNIQTEPRSTEETAQESLLQACTRKILLATVEGFY